MRTFRFLLLFTILTLLLPAVSAWGQPLNYVFRVTNGTMVDIPNGTLLYNGPVGGPWQNRVTAGLPIGFDFNFNNTNYTTFSVSTNGVMALGSTITTSSTNSLTTSGAFPRLSPWWDIIQVGTGQSGCGSPWMRYQTVGTAPNRILVVEFKQMDLVRNSPRWGTWQVRLNETINSIEFYYQKMSPCDVCNQGVACASTSASIGIAASTTRYMSVTPFGATATMSTTSVNNNVNLQLNPIDDNIIYTFTQCGLLLTGQTGPGEHGTVALNNGDTFLNGINVQYGSSLTFRPTVARMADVLCPGSYTMTIGGAAASDYYFGTPGTTSRTVTLTGGVVDTAAITFQPTTTGQRNATLTVTSGTYTRTFNLAGYAPNVAYVGNVAQGGTEAMASGDTLINGIEVRRKTSQTFMPFTLTNVSPMSRTIAYTLTDATGQYSITPNVTLQPGESTSPEITFNANLFGPQHATLRVEAQGGEVRTFNLKAISSAPGANMRVGDRPLDSNSTLFINTYSCVGDQASSLPITIENIGYEDYVVSGIEIYKMDTTYGQGRPSYPFIRDEMDALVPSTDYILTTTPNILPNGSNVISTPFTVPEGESRLIYLTFVSQRPEKRFARIYIRTNGESIASPDTTRELIEGLVSFEVYGRGAGSQLSGSLAGGLPKPVVFAETHVSETRDAELVLFNPGLCPLRVHLPSLSIDEGDVDEFSILSVPTQNVDPVTGDLVIAPGGSDTIWLRFRPRQMGSRRASLRLVTNDSTVVIPGITELGTYYLDVYGTGRADVYAEDIDFGTVVIGGSGIDLAHKRVRMRNTLNRPIVIKEIIFEGVDTADFKQDGTNPWPTLPYEIKGGQEANFGIVFGPPAGGQPGPRVAFVKLITADDDTVYARLTGIAATRTIDVSPTTVDFTPITAGKMARKTITLTNNGTMPLMLQQPVLSAGSDFSYAPLARLMLEPGQNELLEVTYAPQTTGSSTATLTIASNATNGPVQVTLNGTATKTKLADPNPSQSIITGRGEGSSDIFDAADDMSLSGVEGPELEMGMELLQNVPNPANERVEIAYRIEKAGDVRLELYDAAGRMVRLLDAGRRVGEQRMMVDVRDLASGLYHYRLTAGGRTLSRTLTIQR